MGGKKGMSPLIATILLMAFAVALGAVIMNWSAKLPEGGADCSGVKLQTATFCLDGDTLKVGIRNVGEDTLSSIALSISDTSIEIPALQIKNSRLTKGATLNTGIPFTFSRAAEVGIIPFLEVEGEAVACTEPIAPPSTLRPC